MSTPHQNEHRSHMLNLEAQFQAYLNPQRIQDIRSKYFDRATKIFEPTNDQEQGQVNSELLQLQGIMTELDPSPESSSQEILAHLDQLCAIIQSPVKEMTFMSRVLAAIVYCDIMMQHQSKISKKENVPQTLFEAIKRAGEMFPENSEEINILLFGGYRARLIYLAVKNGFRDRLPRQGNFPSAREAERELALQSVALAYQTIVETPELDFRQLIKDVPDENRPTSADNLPAVRERQPKKKKAVIRTQEQNKLAPAKDALGFPSRLEAVTGRFVQKPQGHLFLLAFLRENPTQIQVILDSSISALITARDANEITQTIFNLRMTKLFELGNLFSSDGENFIVAMVTEYLISEDPHEQQRALRMSDLLSVNATLKNFDIYNSDIDVCHGEKALAYLESYCFQIFLKKKAITDLRQDKQKRISVNQDTQSEKATVTLHGLLEETDYLLGTIVERLEEVDTSSIEDDFSEQMKKAIKEQDFFADNKATLEWMAKKGWENASLFLQLMDTWFERPDEDEDYFDYREDNYRVDTDD